MMIIFLLAPLAGAAQSITNVVISEPFFSPNADGVKDTTLITFNLSEVAISAVTIKDSLNNLKTTFYFPALANQNFNVGSDTSLWKIVSGTWGVVSDGFDGRGYECNGIDPDVNGRTIIGSSDTWKDYIAIEADIKAIDVSYKYYIGIIFRASGSPLDNYYCFYVDMNESKFRISKIISEVETELTASIGYGTNFVVGNWHKFKVVMASSTIKCYVDNKIIFDVSDTTLVQGNAGLRVHYAKAVFDNFTVYPAAWWNGRDEANGILPEGSYNAILASEGETSTWTIKIDTSAPAGITTLNAGLGNANDEIKLTWIAPADTSPLMKYEIKYATYSINTSNWSSVGLSSENWSPSASGQPETVFIGGITGGVTYYFAVKSHDSAGNDVSYISNTSTCMTNAAPAIVLVTPPADATTTIGDQALSSPSIYAISWAYSDSNPGDSHSFDIYLSSDNGANYNILITSALPNSTTFYIWETLKHPDSVPTEEPYIIYKLKVIVKDILGLTGSDTNPDSTYFIQIDNRNYQPQVTVKYPNGGQLLSGKVSVNWSLTDKNTGDSHLNHIYISNDGGASWIEDAGSPVRTTYYMLNTASYADGDKYRVMVVSTDNHKTDGGTDEPYTGWDTSDANFFISNANKAPNSFSLVSPANASKVYSSQPTLDWEDATDPEGNFNHYELWYSTHSNFQTKNVVSPITSSEYKITSTLVDKQTYYWMVKAVDTLGASTWANGTNATSGWSFSVSATNIVSGDMEIELIELPSGAEVKVSEVNSTTSEDVRIANASLKTILAAKTISDTAYNISLSPATSTDVQAVIKIKYSDRDNDGYLDGSLISEKYLKIAKIATETGRWKIVEGEQKVDTVNNTVSVSVNKFSTFGLIAYNAPSGLVSNIKNVPNPFNAGAEETGITFILTKQSIVKINIYNLVGDNVWNNESEQTGDSQGMTPTRIYWNGKNSTGMTVANGMYICEIVAEPKDGTAPDKKLHYIGVRKR